MAASDFLSLTVAHQRTIDQICVEFEDRWIASPHPEFQPLLERAPLDIRDVLLTELIKTDIVYRRRRGESVTCESYERRFPENYAAVCAAFGASTEHGGAAESLQVGDVIGRYRLLQPIGAGAFGEVHLARDETLSRDVAIKVLRAGEDDELFLEEARTAARLKHPGIATVYDTGRLADDRPYIVSEYVEGRSLRELLEEDSCRFAPAEAAAFVAGLADTMEYAHRQGIIHRDLEPSNIILQDDGSPKVADFGMALHELQQADRRDEVAGSLGYMAPEQLRGKSQHLDERADVWSLGVILYELICGRRPFAGGTAEALAAEVLEREPKPMRRGKRRIQGRLEQACLRCLQKDPARRWASAADLSRALQTPRFTKWIAAVALMLCVSGILVWQWVSMVQSQVDIRMEVMVNVEDELAPLSLQRPYLRGGDQVYLEVESNKPVHYFVWWVDAAGDATMLYPDPEEFIGSSAAHFAEPMAEPAAAPSAIESVANEREPTRRLRLPTDDTLAWTVPLDQVSGPETIVVLASEQPWLPHNPLPSAPPIGLKRLSAPGWFLDGRRLLGHERAGPTDTVAAPPDRLGDWHQALARRFQPFGAVHAVTFYCGNRHSVLRSKRATRFLENRDLATAVRPSTVH